MLTPKQKNFADEYCAEQNATKAAIRAGYSEKTARSIGQRLLTKVDIKKYIDEKLERLSRKTDITAEWVINELKKNHQLAQQNNEINASNKALELLGKHLQLFTDKMQLQGSLDVAVTIVDDVNGDE